MWAERESSLADPHGGPAATVQKGKLASFAVKPSKSYLCFACFIDTMVQLRNMFCDTTQQLAKIYIYCIYIYIIMVYEES